MCGILFSLGTATSVQTASELLAALERRGPDSTNTITKTVQVKQSHDFTSYHLSFTSTVLSLRGSTTVRQPYTVVESSSLLCWNGEAWSVSGQPIEDNDTERVFRMLEQAIMGSADEVRSCLSTIAGPYAFVYYDATKDRIYFGRDYLGRRSLLWQVDEHDNLIISSVAMDSALPWQEIDADGIYCIDLARSSDLVDIYMGEYAVTRLDYQYIDSRPSSISVLPRLLLNKEVSSSSALLSQHSSAVSSLQERLYTAVSSRVIGIPDPPTYSNNTDTVSRLAILFSGGLDCTVLARIAHDIMPKSEPIDLLNVAFENPRVHKMTKEPYELCPDRITGRLSYQELQQICTGREWRFIAINVPYTETLAHRETIIALMYPHNTEMDLSISCALYFASRGIGEITEAGTKMHYTTTSRVLLSGLGADELFAGYTRHATAYRRDGFQGLFEELDLDIGRLGRRNLGRDDRVISNWAKEVRFPYLDEALVHWALQAPIQEKTGFGETDRLEAESTNSTDLEPGKKALRCLAWKLGMSNVAKEKKRAIQFGARTAKMETGKTKGTTLLS